MTPELPPAIARHRSLSLRIALTASAFVLAASLLVGGYVIVEARAVMHARAAAALDVSMRMLRSALHPDGAPPQFSVVDGQLRIGGRVIDERETSVDQIERVFGGNATIFLGDVRVATSVRRPSGERAVGTKLAPGPIHDTVLGHGTAYRGEADILGVPYQTLYEPIRNDAGAVIGVLYVGRKTSEVLAGIDRITTQAALVGAAIVLVSLTLLWLGLRRTLRPLGVLRSAMDSLARGLTGTEVPYRARRDEIGAMAGAVQVFKDNLLHTRALEAETAQARASSEEQRKVGMRQMADRFEAAVSGVIGSVTAAATELEATARGMSDTAGATAQQSGTVASAAAEAAGNVQTVAAAAEQLGASVQEIARQVAGSSSLTQQAETASSQTTRLVNELSRSAEQIGAMVGLISSIAGQTNLLALNATIEAARAGETGRGFAVVAAEVKELANQTARATDEIGQRIGQIQGVTVEAVEAIGGIGARIRELNAVAGSIAAAVEQQGAATQEIVRNVAQASSGTSAVTNNIAGVARSSEETGTAAAQVLDAAFELSRQSEQLRAEIGGFLSTVRAA